MSTKPGKIIVFSAPSGAGKSTLLDHLRSAVPGLVYSISATTRPPRTGEVEGIHYFFLSTAEFKDRIARNEFAEWQQVHANFYGTPRSFIDESIGKGRHVVMDIDVKGKTQLDASYPRAVGILVLPPSMEDLEKRLRLRKTDSEESIRIRLANARDEIEYARTKGKYEHTVINDDLTRACGETVALVSSIIAS